MGRPRLPYRKKADTPNFIGLWKKSEGPEKSYNYYPFGLTYNSYSRENSVPNRYKFQGQEHIDDLDLGWNSFKWRNQDPSIGRFFNIDPLAEKYTYNSPYAFSENKVTNDVELEGLEAVNPQAALNKEVDKAETAINNNVVEPIKKAFKAVADFAAYIWNTPDRIPKEQGGGQQSGDGVVVTGPGGDDSNLPKPDPNGNTYTVDKSVIDALGAVADGPPPPPSNIGDKAELVANAVDKAGNAAQAAQGSDVLPTTTTRDTIPGRDSGSSGTGPNNKYIIVQDGKKVDSAYYVPDDLMPKKK